MKPGSPGRIFAKHFPGRVLTKSASPGRVLSKPAFPGRVLPKPVFPGRGLANPGFPGSLGETRVSWKYFNKIQGF